MLLADWLRQLSALAEGEGFVPQRIVALDLERRRADRDRRGRVRGVGAPGLRAITDEGLLYEPAPDSHRFHARAMLSHAGRRGRRRLTVPAA